MRLVTGIVLGWLCGVCSYMAALETFWGQSISGGDRAAVLFWSGAATGLTVPLVYWPALKLLSSRIRGYRPFVAFPVAAIALGVVPTAFIMLMVGGGFRDLASPEALLFYCMFTGVGVVVGSAFALGRPPAEPTEVQSFVWDEDR